MILAIGDLVWDMVVRPDQPLLPGGDTTGQIELLPGGSAANVAVWCARAGGEVGFIGAVGTDILSKTLAEDLHHEGVTCYLTQRDQRPTGIVLALIDRDGQRSFVTNQGADWTLQPADVPHAALQRARHLHLTAWALFQDPPRAAARHAAQLAQQAGATLSLDPASYQMIRDMGVAAFLDLTAGLTIDLLFPNRDEGQLLTGESDPPAITSRLRQLYPQAQVVLKLDHEGCYLHTHQFQRFCPPETPTTVIDTTGAGDSFAGAFLARWLQDGNLFEAARIANRVGGWVVAHTGARPPIDQKLQKLLLG